MARVLTVVERRILEAACNPEPEAGGNLTDAVRRTVGQLPGPDFRRGVASLAERRLIRASVRTKPDGDLGRVVIEGVTPLGRSLVRPSADREGATTLGQVGTQVEVERDVRAADRAAFGDGRPARGGRRSRLRGPTG